MAYNPNKAVEGIVDYKHKYDHAKATGKDTSEFEKGAAAYYKELRDNGRSDVADYLQKSDSITAGEYLKTLTPNYQATAGDLQAKSNEAYKWTTDTANQLGKDYDMVYHQTVGVTPTRTDYGKDILGGYGLAAEGAYKGTLGGASVDNGGNVDSYAAAQANRNKAAMVKEGYGTVLDYYNSIAGNATNWANSKANALGGFAGLMQGNITDDRDTIEKAYAGTVDLEKTRMTTDAEKHGYDTGLEGTKYTADRNLESNKYGYDVNKYLGEIDGSMRAYEAQLGAATTTKTDAMGNQSFFGFDNLPTPVFYTGQTGGMSTVPLVSTTTATNGTTVAGADGTTATVAKDNTIAKFDNVTGNYYNANGEVVGNDGKTRYYADANTKYIYDKDGNIATYQQYSDPNALIIYPEAVQEVQQYTMTGDYKDLPDNGGRRSAVTPIVENKQYDNMYGSGSGSGSGSDSGSGSGSDSKNNEDEKISQTIAERNKAEAEGRVEEPIKNKSVLNMIDSYIKSLETNEKKAKYILDLVNNLGIGEGEALWLINKYGIELAEE